MAYFERSGISEHMRQTRVGPILASTSCRYRRPLEYPDVVTIGTRIGDVGVDRFTMYYRVVSRTLGAVAAEGEGVVVMYDYANRCKAPLPDAVRAAMEAIAVSG